MRFFSSIIAALALGSLMFTACDGNGGDGTRPDGGPLTVCTLKYKPLDDTKKDYGEGCESDDDCAYGACLKPGVGGNITNEVFGFCTRGCDCNEDSVSRIPASEKEVLDCLYPSGFNKMHHIVVECANVAECKDLDPRWNACRIASSGNARKVCHADAAQ